MPVANMSDQARITVRRTTSYADRLRAYEVNLDGIPAGSVRALGAVTVPVAPGKHSLTPRIDWCGSPQIDFEAQPGNDAVFECGSSLTGWRLLLAFFYVLFGSKQYLGPFRPLVWQAQRRHGTDPSHLRRHLRVRVTRRPVTAVSIGHRYRMGVANTPRTVMVRHGAAPLGLGGLCGGVSYHHVAPLAVGTGPGLRQPGCLWPGSGGSR